MLLFFGAPILYALLTGYVYKSATIHDLPIVVVDLDNSPLSNKIIDALDDNTYLKVAEVNYEQKNVDDEIIRKNYVAVVTIPIGFEGNILQKRPAEIDADINGANMLTANYASTGIQTVLSIINSGIEIEALQKKGIPNAIANRQFEGFRINITRFYNPASNYLIFLWPGLLGVILQQVFLLVLALSFAKEFEDNTFKNLLKYSQNSMYLIFLKSIPYWLLGIALWLPITRLYFYWFNVPMVQHLGAFYLISALFILSLAFMGIASSIVFKTQLRATEVLMIIATPSFIISGQTWPLSEMPVIIRYISDIIPLTHFLEGFRKLLLCNASLSEIMPQVVNLAILSVVFLVIAFFSLRYRITGKSYLIKKIKARFW
ncbi:MAG TPA: ABC transporter permease [Bacteroidales bacterium]|nr:ABC transporter permease [Bacteroidales bacterium]